jgi:tetratricopeptide (TPR) repeat protein
MSSTPSFATRVGLPSLALLIFYWALLVPFGSRFKHGSARTPEQMRRLIEQTQSLMSAGKFTLALEPALALAAADPESHVYLRHLAQIYHGLERWPDEAHAWEQFQEHAPLPVEACPQIGIAYLKQSRIDEASRAFQHCYDLDNENADSIFYLALSFERKGDLQRAAEFYQHGLKINPDYADLQVGLARTQLQMGRPEQARRGIEKVLEQEPSNVDALLVAGLASWRSGDRRAARGYLEKGSRLSPGYADFRTALESMAREEAGQ